MMIEQNTNYAYKLKYLENPTFDKVRDLAIKFMRELPKQLQDELYEALNRGVDILDSEPQMVTYLYAFGPMHQAKLNYAFKHLPKEFLEQPEINIIDYGCGQTIGIMCYADFLRKSGYSQQIKTLTLVEPSEICLKRAALHASMFLHDAEIKTVNKRFDDLTSDDIMCSMEVPTLHIFSNVLDMLCFDLKQCASLINSSMVGYNQFVCVGPFFNYSDKDDRMEQFCSLLSGDDYYCKSFDKYEFEEQKAWTAHILCFAVRKPIDDGLSTEVSKTDIDNGVEDEYGVLYSIDGKRLLQCRNYRIESYSIKKGTKVICDLAFGDVLEHPCESLREIVIPDTVTRIGYGAFMECNSLQQITIPNSVVEIGNNAFWMCKSLHQIHLPNSISNIGEGAFSDCRFLRQIILPDSVSSIEKETFMGCCSLQEIIIPDSIENIEECAFYGCKSLQQVNIPNSVISVGKEAFRHCASLQRITFSNPAITVGDEALSGCLSLQQIIIPRGSSEKFKKILDEELWNKIVESSNSESIKSSNELEGLSTTFTNNEIDNGVKDEFGIVYSRDGKRLLKCDNLKLENYSILDSVRSIGSVAFSNCSLLRQIIIPVSVTSIGGGAFRGCSSLQQIIIPDSVTHIGGGAFAGCKSLQQIIIPDSITSIEAGVFGSCSSLQQITIPNSVKSIGFWAFAGCKSLQQVIIPIGSKEKFKKILDEEMWDKLVETSNETFSTEVIKEDLEDAIEDEYGVLYSRDGKRLLKCGESHPEIYTIKDGTRAICNNAFDEIWNRGALRQITIPDSVTIIGNDAFRYCETLRHITIPQSIITIGDNPFCGCDIVDLKSNSKLLVVINQMLIERKENRFVAYFGNEDFLTIPDSVKCIGGKAFAYCDLLRKVIIPASVDEICHRAFAGCRALQKIIIPPPVKSIGSWAFDHCDSLKTIDIANSVKHIGNGTFHGCSSLQQIIIPDSVTTIGDEVFEGCGSLQHVHIPESVTSIGVGAFAGCNSLRQIHIPDSVISIGEEVFDDCNSLQQIIILKGSIDRFRKILPEELWDKLVEQ